MMEGSLDLRDAVVAERHAVYGAPKKSKNASMRAKVDVVEAYPELDLSDLSQEELYNWLDSGRVDDL